MHCSQRVTGRWSFGAKSAIKSARSSTLNKFFVLSGARKLERRLGLKARTD